MSFFVSFTNEFVFFFSIALGPSLSRQIPLPDLVSLVLTDVPVAGICYWMRNQWSSAEMLWFIFTWTMILAKFSHLSLPGLAWAYSF